MFCIKRAIGVALANHALNHADLSKISGISNTTISQIKNSGNPTLQTMQKLSGGLGITLGAFIGYGENGQ
tara:strand:- start:244 stop:453 length:210 start_codon:yes stop_codon:yes gene_type:complete